MFKKLKFEKSFLGPFVLSRLRQGFVAYSSSLQSGLLLSSCLQRIEESKYRPDPSTSSGRTGQLAFLLILTIPHTLFCYYQTRPITIMINPAGDAQHTGRRIEDTFERGITLQCAEQLKKIIEITYPHIAVILTRFPGEMVKPLQHANFANRLNVDLYLSIHFYYETGIKPNMYLYRFSYNDDFMVPSQPLAFYSYDQAHLNMSKKTGVWSEQIKQIITQPGYAKKFNVHGVYKLPFAPLIGIKAPAIGIEASLKNKDDWNVYIDPIVECVGDILETYPSTGSGRTAL